MENYKAMITNEAIMKESWKVAKSVSPQLPFSETSFQFGARWIRKKLIKMLVKWAEKNLFNIEDQAGVTQIVIDYDELIKFINKKTIE